MGAEGSNQPLVESSVEEYVVSTFKTLGYSSPNETSFMDKQALPSWGKIVGDISDTAFLARFLGKLGLSTKVVQKKNSVQDQAFFAQMQALNAGIGDGGTIEGTSFELWEKVHKVDLDSVFFGCKYALPYMREDAPSSIVNISSIAGLIAGHNMAAYNSAKAGVWMLSKSVALHCARKNYNIRCNSVHPSFVDTPILDSFTASLDRESLKEKLIRQIPLGRIGEVNDVAYAVLYLASDESKFVTGSELKVDGGISAM